MTSIYVVEKVKQSINGCGGETQVEILEPTPDGSASLAVLMKPPAINRIIEDFDVLDNLQKLQRSEFVKQLQQINDQAGPEIEEELEASSSYSSSSNDEET
jgi:hypothetical protein